MHVARQTLQSGGRYAHERTVYQAYAPLLRVDHDYVAIGAWMVGDQPAGIGLREDDSSITRDTSRFVPHYFV